MPFISQSLRPHRDGSDDPARIPSSQAGQLDRNGAVVGAEDVRMDRGPGKVRR